MDIITDDVVTAKKEHRCSFCGKTIVPGERYRNQFIADGGDSYTWKSCLPCERFVEKFNVQEGCWDEGITQMDFQDSVIELWREQFPLEDVKQTKTWQKVLRLLEGKI